MHHYGAVVGSPAHRGATANLPDVNIKRPATECCSVVLAGWFAGDRAKGLDGTLESRDLKWCRDDVSVIDRLQQELMTRRDIDTPVT